MTRRIAFVALAWICAVSCERSTTTAPGGTGGTGANDARAPAKPELPPEVRARLDACTQLAIATETGESAAREPMLACQAMVTLTPEVDAELQSRCDGGDGAACHTLGDALRGERVVGYDAELVHAWCGKKSPCDALRKHYAVIGFATKPTEVPARARALLERGCELGRGDACLVRGMIDNDLLGAAGWMARGCTAGSAPACANAVHQDIMLGNPDATPAMVEQVAKLCSAGKPSACATLGVLVARGDDVAVATGKPALDLFSEACTAKSAGACASLIFHAVHDKLDAARRDAAATELASACKQGDVGPHCAAAAFALQRGWGAKADKSAAKAWLAKNCEAGVEAACPPAKR